MEPAAATNWDAIFRNIVTPAAAGREGQDRVTASPEFISKFESEASVSLPDEYKRYSLVFGPGLICGYFWIAVPFPGDAMLSLLTVDRDSPGHWPDDALQEIYSDADVLRIKRMLFFAYTIGGDQIGWDLTERTSESPLEYAIYVLNRDYPESVRLASTFSQFVIRFCLGGEFSAILNFANPGHPVRQTFEPLNPCD